ncbi:MULTISPECIES: rod shape-determining protein RodA [unclassified Flavobacterium]|uniref:rod shape-determining protein RodA n=1 Tax=unclassified Flavobacterium TaxID=196869 RepID=UPI001F13A360|nr:MULTISPECIES: rod shape-determining protein RodA [unclassified Flavobacterium]UMY65928.1 rod shape-determining protein RodA [Flavobacterium sp. HJ-32-4]
MKNQSTRSNMDWVMVTIYIVLVVLGWLNIYSSTIPESGQTDLTDISQFYSKQLVNIFLAIPLIIIVLSVDGKFYEKFTSIIYVAGLLLVAGLFVFGKEVKGQTNWYSFGSFSLQPAEFAKIATALAVAKYLSDIQINLKDTQRQVQVLGIIFLPILLIVPHDPGSALIFMTFFFVLYREGLPSWYLWTGFAAILLFVMSLLFEPIYIIGGAALLIILNYYRSKIVNRNIILSSVVLVAVAVFTLSVSYVFNNVFEQHHRDRFNVLLGEEVDVKGIGYNTNQSKIAVGSGGVFGKGFMEGTQTKGGFVPEQHTDYAFTIVAEEWGFTGSIVVIALFMGLIARILYLAERQKTKFSRVYGYCVASILFIHFFVNVSMVLGIFPTVGVPLPFFSYGGSGLWAFTVLLFIFIKLDANKVNEW